MDSVTHEVVAGPEVISRGFVYVKESEELMEEITEEACKAIESCYLSHNHDWNSVKLRVRDNVSKFLRERTRRSPMVLPIIMEV